jgi:hypothetical protein
MISCQSPLNLNSVNSLAIVNGSWSFGEAFLLDNKEIAHTFIVKNVTDKPIILTQIKVGCPCLVASTKNRLPVRIAAQGTEKITIKVLLGAIPPTKLDKTVLLYAGEEIVGRLIVQGTIVTMASLTPAPLALGNILVGTTATFPLHLTLHPRLQNVTPPRLISSLPYLTIADNTVTIALDAPIGPLSGAITFDVPITDKTPLAAIWRLAGITFFGTIKGDIAAEPSAVNFGIVRSGNAVMREVRLIENVPGVTKNVIITTESSLIKTEWQEKTSTLRLTLAPNFPAGNFQSGIMIATANGQKLRLAITAYKV